MDFVNIIGTLYDNSIEHIVALAHLIKDLRLNKFLQDINEEVGNNIEELSEETKTIKDLLRTQKENINSLSEEISNSNQILFDKITKIEDGTTPINTSDIKHIFLSLEEYNLLQNYERNTLYLIIEPNTSSHFGDVFPFTLE